MRNYLSALLAVLLFSCTASASFTFLYSLNGNQSSDVDNTFYFVHPSGVLSNGGLLYIADSSKDALYVFNGTVRQKYLHPSGTMFSGPMRMTYDFGTLYIADGSSGKIKTYTGVGGNIDEWNTATNMERASGLALDALGAYITDLSKKKVYIYSRATKAYSRVAIETGGSDGLLSAPADIELYKGKFFVSDTDKGVIYVYDSNFTFLSSIGRGKGGVTLVSPKGISVYNDRIYVADSGASRVVAFSMDGYPVDILNESTLEGNISYPEDVFVADGTLFVADTGNKLIKAFAVNETLGNDAVLAEINGAQDSIVSLRQLQSSAGKLGLTYNKLDSLDTDLLSAKEYYNNYVFTSASSIAQSVQGTANTEISSLSQIIDFRIRQRVKASQDKVAPYRAGAAGSLSSQLSQFDNKAALALAKASAKSYSDATDLTIDASNLADSIYTQATTKETADAENSQKMKVTEANMRIDIVAARLSSVEADAAAYQQTINSTNAHVMIDSAREYVIDGDFAAANHSLELASIETGSFESSLSKTTGDIKRALDSITVQEMDFNSTSSLPFLQPDLASETKTMAQAKALAYTNPTLATAMAKQAHDSAVAKLRDSNTITVTVFATISIIGVIAALAAAFFLYVTRMRKKSSL